MTSRERASTGTPSVRQRLRSRWKASGAEMFERAMADNLGQMTTAVASHRGLDVLDLGCWDGANAHRYLSPDRSAFGVEFAPSAAAIAAKRGLRVIVADLRRPLPVRSASFDIVTSNQVIEHLPDTDLLMAEAYRVLRPGGMLVVSTENLSSWHNIAALTLGWQAFSLTNVSRTAFGLGNPLANLRGEEPLEPGWEHLRIFSWRGLKELAEAHGFADARVVGAGYYPLPPGTARLDPRHATFITLIARR